jgi:SAM-dependent methyltransferase
MNFDLHRFLLLFQAANHRLPPGGSCRRRRLREPASNKTAHASILICPGPAQLPASYLSLINIPKGNNPMKTIDPTVLAGYNAGIERDRLRTGMGLIEFERTKEILTEHLPKPPAVIYDIGGGYGEYAWWLASLGYEVHLFDLSETNIAMSRELAAEYPHTALASSMVCDARMIPRECKTADAILLMGPLYSITDYKERLLALKECYRLLKDDGILFSAAITPYGALIARITAYRASDSRKSFELDDPAVLAMMERALSDGCYENPERKLSAGLGSSHMHTAKALREELSAVGFKTLSVHGVMGGAWLAPNLHDLMTTPATKETLMKTVRLLDTHEEIIGLSGHLLAISKKG